ncbi:MAG: hypothetical protein R2761_26185 [Acidimicrobiales bacterium]
MSFIGTGGEDWVELDMDLFERSRVSALQSILVDRSPMVEAAIGTPYEVETADDGTVYLLVGGRRRFQAEVGYDERLLLTSVLAPDGPL